jgi:hypothetical protein
MTKLKTIPIVLDWDYDKEIGWMTVDTDELPKSPDFVFAIGYRQEQDPRYVINAVSVLSDEKYKKYLEK